MSVRLVLPSQLQELNRGRGALELGSPVATVAGAFEALRASHPGLYDRIVTERFELRPHVNVFVDGEDIRWCGGLDAPVREHSEVMILPAVSGG